MEATITVVVKVSEIDHAEKIQMDIKEAVRLRTPIYHITKPIYGKGKTISDYGKEMALKEE